MKTNTTPQVLYTEPQLCKTGNNWYVYFRFYNVITGEWKLIKCKEGLNREPDLKKRALQGNAIAEARALWLAEGWNPILDREYKLRRLQTTEQRQGMSFREAMIWAFNKKAIREKSKSGYKSQLGFILEYADKTGLSMLPIAKIDRGICFEILDGVKQMRIEKAGKFSNHSYNKYGDTLRAMFTVLVNRSIVTVNPLWQKEKLGVPESNKYEPFTDDEKTEIARHLLNTHYGLYRVMQVVYHTGIRPMEVLALKVREIDLKRRFITISPIEESETVNANSKTNSVRHVPINNHLLDIFGTLKLHNYPGDYFVFGSPFEPGKGNRGGGSTKWFEGVDRPGKEFGFHIGRGKMGKYREDFLTPSATQARRDTITRLWKELIIDGLGINKHLYAAKHTGTDDKIAAGLSLGELQIMYGHESESMTARYHKHKKLLEAQTAIIDKSPDFLSKQQPGKLRKVS